MGTGVRKKERRHGKRNENLVSRQENKCAERHKAAKELNEETNKNQE